jgi:hypothetical protein
VRATRAVRTATAAEIATGQKNFSALSLCSGSRLILRSLQEDN